MLLEQYRKTASLFPHGVAMVNLGDDFRFDFAIEWDQQYRNYMKLFEFINAHKDIYNAEVKFGTISEYFDVNSNLASRSTDWVTREIVRT